MGNYVGTSIYSSSDAQYHMLGTVLVLGTQGSQDG
jgi:hypothetical protein